MSGVQIFLYFFLYFFPYPGPKIILSFNLTPLLA